MALTDWTEQVDPTGIGAASDRSQAGSLSLFFDSDASDKIITNDESESAGPAEGRVETYINVEQAGSSSQNLFGAIARYVDSDNFYAIIIDWNGNVSLERFVDGSHTQVTIPSAGQLNTTADTWHQYRFTFWEDDGVFNTRVEQDAGSGYTLLGNDMSDAQNEHAAGGAIGMGTVVGTLSNNTDGVWIDETEVFY